MTVSRASIYLTIITIFATLAVARVSSFPEPNLKTAVVCNEAKSTKPAVGQIGKLIGDYTRHRAGVAAALSGCR